MNKPADHLVELYTYEEVVDAEQTLLMLSPGIFQKDGGMFSYAKVWINEIRNFSQNYTFLFSRRYQQDLSGDHLIFRTIKSDNKKYAMVISLLSVILPFSLLKYFFNDYREFAINNNQIHILTSFLLAYPLIRCLMKFKKELTIIYTLHDPVPHQEKRGPIGKKLKFHYLHKIYELSRVHPNFYLHLHSKKLLEDCQHTAGKVIIKPHPLPEKLVVPKNSNFDGFVFGVLGRMEAYKGLDILLEAFQVLSKDADINNKIKLAIVGSGEIDKESWEQLPILTDIQNRRVDEIEFHEYISSLDCLLLPYRKASQSGVGYLALAYEIPIIATNTGGLPDIIKQSSDPRSRLISPNKSGELVDAILSFMKIEQHSL
ncbi:glycosyltransferase [Muriicola soli]|uniref:Glycosyltransferase family 1 protein n=1 Tax=Muriicola soli TaxID=2507538 RepID=A0A411ECY8_9FLAO|nr:glycosyltransferase [Muriicola soli]QBA65403.1 glycosyltransferase family 1 protein [Muriicola soli]